MLPVVPGLRSCLEERNTRVFLVRWLAYLCLGCAMLHDEGGEEGDSVTMAMGGEVFNCK